MANSVMLIFINYLLRNKMFLLFIDFGIFNTEYGIFNIDFGVFNTKYDIFNIDFGIFNTVGGIFNIDFGIFNTEYGIFNIDFGIFNIFYRILYMSNYKDTLLWKSVCKIPNYNLILHTVYFLHLPFWLPPLGGLRGA